MLDEHQKRKEHSDGQRDRDEEKAGGGLHDLRGDQPSLTLMEIHEVVLVGAMAQEEPDETSGHHVRHERRVAENDGHHGDERGVPEPKGRAPLDLLPQLVQVLSASDAARFDEKQQVRLELEQLERGGKKRDLQHEIDKHGRVGEGVDEHQAHLVPRIGEQDAQEGAGGGGDTRREQERGEHEEGKHLAHAKVLQIAERVVPLELRGEVEAHGGEDHQQQQEERGQVGRFALRQRDGVHAEQLGEVVDAGEQRRGGAPEQKDEEEQQVDHHGAQQMLPRRHAQRRPEDVLWSRRQHCIPVRQLHLF